MQLNGITDSDITQAKTLTQWDKAILDARNGIKRLELAIQTCEEMKAKGESWPGDVQQDDTISRSCILGFESSISGI